MNFRIVLSDAVVARLKKIGKWAAWVAGVGGATGFVFVLSFYLAMKVEMRSTEVRVPDFTLLTIDEASVSASPLELQLQVVDQRHDPAVASGKILQQEPAPGSSVRRGRKVKLVLSLGGEVLEVPDLTGKGDRAVEIELRRDGFAPGDEARVHSARANQGRIVGQVPPAGSPAVPNTRVHRLVSEGARATAWVMPDLTGLSRTAAERWIRVSGFRVGPVRRIPAVGRASGSVVGQIPLAGYPVRSKEIIELTVAR
jgi:serine/threonine-protein kinase